MGLLAYSEFDGGADAEDDAIERVEVLRRAHVRPQKKERDGEKEDDEGSDEEGSDEEDEDEEEEKGRRNRKASLRVDHVGVAELASEKLEAIFSAIEIACAIIGVDEVRVDRIGSVTVGIR